MYVIFFTESSTCRLTIIREGMYGTLEVSWQSGFPEGRVPVDFVEGTVVPDSSNVIIPHGIDEKNFTISVILLLFYCFKSSIIFCILRL